jgi:hypothetical protein
MMQVSVSRETPAFHQTVVAYPRRISLPLLRTAALEILSIGSFLCVCVALIAEFS